ncbi:MAG: DUF3352 domain-containing protein [Oscillatoriales cyanobacterium SM2_2_1]|nr:DUF3352 domain-containing protein [Oscillatoriales cyanobacterium SM2_2_1]
MFGLILATTTLQPLQTFTLGQAERLPADSLGIVTFVTDSNQWRGVPFDPLSLASGALLQQIAAAVGLSAQSLSFERDLRPWIGQHSALVFFLPSKGMKVSQLLLLRSRDQKAFAAFQQRLSEGNRAAIAEVYRGVPIQTWVRGKDGGSSPETALVIALLPDDTVVLGRDKAAVQQYLDGRDRPDQARLSNLPLFRRAVGNALWGRSLVAGYGNYTALAEYWKRLEGTEAEFLQGFQASILDQYTHYDMVVWPAAGGLRLRSSAYARRPLPVVTYPSRRLLQRLPAEVLTVAASSNLRSQWQWVEQESKRNIAYSFVVGLINEAVQSSFNLNIRRDLLPWLGGEYAFVVYPTQTELMDGFWGTRDLKIGFGLLLETSDRRRTEMVLRSINQAIPRLTKQRVRPVSRRLGSVTMTSFEVDRTNSRRRFSVLSYGWQNNRTLMVTSGLGAARGLMPPRTILANSGDFQRAIAQLPQQNYGYSYTNLSRFAQLGVEFFTLASDGGKLDPTSSQVVEQLKKLGSLTVVYSQTPEAFTTDAYLSVPMR